MRNLAEVFESLVNSFNNQEKSNFIDLRDLERHIGSSNSYLFESIVTDYNEDRVINFFLLKQLQGLAE